MEQITNAQVIDEWSHAYEALEPFGPEGDFGRQHLLNPTIFRLLGPVQGKRILDAGCGQGYLCRLLAQQGALVTGVEPVAVAYQYAVAQEQAAPLGISYRQADLSVLDGLHNTFDAVVSNMVFMDIPDYESAMHNCIAALKRGGSFVLSLQHPCFEEPSAEWVKKGYVAVREYLNPYTIKTTFGRAFHRPLSHYLNLVIREGCILQEIIEPQLDAALAQQDLGHERNVHVPSFVVIHATKA